MNSSPKTTYFEYGVVGVVMAATSLSSTWLILGEMWFDQVAFMLLFAGWNFWCGYRESSLVRQ
jgi:hypothetical protein